jgi:hypothetical protein
LTRGFVQQGLPLFLHLALEVLAWSCLERFRV